MSPAEEESKKDYGNKPCTHGEAYVWQMYQDKGGMEQSWYVCHQENADDGYQYP